MKLYQLIYKSDVQSNLDIKHIHDFSTQIQQSNLKNKITGLLLFDGMHFLQVLEGNKSNLKSIFRVICADPRHKNITQLLMEPIPAREFEQWSMQIIIRKSEDLQRMLHDLEALGDLLKVGEAGETSSVIISQYYQSKDSLGRSPKIVKSFLEGGWESAALIKDDGLHRKTIKVDCQKSQLDHHYAHNFAFQPIVDVDTQSISAIEALLRGNNGESPESLLNHLSESDRHKLDVESKRTAISAFADFGCNTTLSVNLLPASMTSYPEIVDELRVQAESLSIDPARITIEITEQEAIENYEVFIDVVNQVRTNGMRLAIDDFGAGYAGMSLLADFQPHKLKIDRKIINGIASHGPRQAIVCAIMLLSMRLGIEVIAEGVESSSDLDWLKSVGVHLFQGYYFARPSLLAIPEISL